ncbi:MAG: PorT family protein [bacterium]|nr:MAG: PorT family protein [bacterium]
MKERERIVKRLCLIVASTVLATLIGNAAIAGDISLGAKVGMITANITQTPKEWEQTKSFKVGFMGGVYLNYAFNENFSIQPELLYTQKGVKDNLYDGFITIDLTASFDYIELPVLAKYTFTWKESFKPYIYAGPSFAATVSSELEVSALLLSTEIDFSDLTHVTDFGLVAGAGFDYALGKGVLVFDTRFQIGFTNVILSGDFEIDGSTQTIDEDDFKNFGFAFMAGYGI